MNDQKKQILSCIQPTGQMHFGNYFGAVQNWVRLQTDYDCIYGIVDYHAMTIPYKAKELKDKVSNMVVDLLACGIHPENLFVQSLIPEHTELAWILGCFTSYGELSRMTQFKDKSQQLKEKSKSDFISTGLFTYPVLQAADILIYRADFVPVGKDQEQHLELSRNIAIRFNKRTKSRYFRTPRPLFTAVPKIMSLADPTKKMSKSLGEKHYIAILDADKRIRKKVRSAVTDSGTATHGQISPGVKALFELLKCCEKTEQLSVFQDQYQAGTIRYSELKNEVAEALVAISNNIKTRKAELLENPVQVREQLLASSENIRKKAQQTLREVRALTGLSSF